MLFGTPPNPGSDATPWTMSDVYFPNFDCNTPPAPPPLARRGHQMVSTPQQQSTPPAQQQHHQHQHQLLHPYHRQQQQQQPPPPSPAFYLRTPPHPQVAVVQPARRQLAMPATPAEAMGCFAPPSNFQLAGEAVAYRGADGLSATDMYLTATGQPHATLPTYDDEVDSDNEDKTLRSLAEAVGLGSSHAHQHLLQQTAEDLAASSHHFGLGSDPMLGPAPGTLRGPLPSSRRRSRNQQRVAQSVTIASWLAQHFEVSWGGGQERQSWFLITRRFPGQPRH